jgi:hypothetical protein
MERKMSSSALKCGLALVVAGAFVMGVGKASARPLLPGNVWPNPTLETIATTPDFTGEVINRPAGWHRGGGDFNNPSPTITFWDTGMSLSPTHSLYDMDHDVNNYGEWFSDFNAVPAGSALTGVPFKLRFNWKYNIQNEVHRVSVRWGDASGNDIGGGPDALAQASDPPVTVFTEVNETLTPPLAAATFRLTVSSGGSSAAFGDLWVDDISAAVPEPTSLAFLTAGTMLLLSSRRRV